MFGIGAVLFIRRKTKVYPSIVAWLTIDVINFILWPLPCHIEKSEPMRFVLLSIDLHLQITFYADCSRNLSDLLMIN